MEKTIIGKFEIRQIDKERIEIRPMIYGKTIDNLVSLRNLYGDVAGSLQADKVIIDNQKSGSASIYLK